MSTEAQKFCRTCNWSSRDETGQVKYCLRKTVIDLVEGPRIVPLNPQNERNFMGGCGKEGRFWKEHDPKRMPGMLDERLLP